MTTYQREDVLIDLLRKRVKPTHLRQRLGIEADSEARIFGQGRNFFHIENLLGADTIIRAATRLSMLHQRGRRNALDIVVRHNHVHLSSLPEEFEGYCILHISDLHLDMNGEIPQALSECVRDLHYDACALTGDFRYLTHGPYEAALQGMERVRVNLHGPVFGVLGNHDTIRLVPPLESMGIQMLLNESVALKRGDAQIYLAGIDDPHYYRTENLEDACQDIPHRQVSILLAHSPEIYRHAAHANFDLLLCGHTHAGQIRLPGGLAMMYNADCPRSMCEGSWKFHQMQGYTSAGAGSSVVDLRFNCPPEVTLHFLHGA